MALPPVVSILLLSEDTGADAPHVSVHVARRMLRLVDSHAQTQRIQFLPLRDGEPGYIATCANQWKSQGAKFNNAHKELIKEIATRVSAPNSFVFFHVDADVTWARRMAMGGPENAREFEQRIRAELRRFFVNQKLDESEIQRRSGRLFLLMPYYSIEAWLYQNTEVARELCETHHQGKHVSRIAEWEVDRGLLDEIEQPKKDVCLSDKFNRRLAETLPAEQAQAADKSFAQVITSLRTSEAFINALASTHQNST